MNLRPLGNRVILKEIKEEKTESGIILPDSAVSLSSIAKGKVISAGPGEYQSGVFILMKVSEGETVIFDKRGADPIKIENEEYLLVKDSDIHAICEENPKE